MADCSNARQPEDSPSPDPQPVAGLEDAEASRAGPHGQGSIFGSCASLNATRVIAAGADHGPPDYARKQSSAALELPDVATGVLVNRASSMAEPPSMVAPLQHVISTLVSVPAVDDHGPPAKTTCKHRSAAAFELPDVVTAEVIRTLSWRTKVALCKQNGLTCRGNSKQLLGRLHAHYQVAGSWLRKRHAPPWHRPTLSEPPLSTVPAVDDHGPQAKTARTHRSRPAFELPDVVTAEVLRTCLGEPGCW